MIEWICGDIKKGKNTYRIVLGIDVVGFGRLHEHYLEL